MYNTLIPRDKLYSDSIKDHPYKDIYKSVHLLHLKLFMTVQCNTSQTLSGGFLRKIIRINFSFFTLIMQNLIF